MRERGIFRPLQKLAPDPEEVDKEVKKEKKPKKEKKEKKREKKAKSPSKNKAQQKVEAKDEQLSDGTKANENSDTGSAPPEQQDKVAEKVNTILKEYQQKKRPTLIEKKPLGGLSKGISGLGGGGLKPNSKLASFLNKL